MRNGVDASGGVQATTDGTQSAMDTTGAGDGSTAEAEDMANDTKATGKTDGVSTGNTSNGVAADGTTNNGAMANSTTGTNATLPAGYAAVDAATITADQLMNVRV